MATELDAADAVELCQELLKVTQTLEKGQTACIHFHTWAGRERVVKLMSERYHEADLRRLEFGLFH